MQGVQGQLDGGVGAALVGGARVVAGDPAGQGVDRGHHHGGAGVG
ncbi:MAG: hypothetical protein QOG98_263, partial [Pseudonocardiales bacterium]|nr:hypothetical protein [Pseudonocardiales bacterium]